MIHQDTDIATDMPWLAKAWHSVQKQLTESRLPHALIINGERGVGKRAWADAVAGLLLCDQLQTDSRGMPQACGHCKQCELKRAGSHPDVRVYAPEKSRMVRIVQIRELIAFASASPQVGQRKIAIIDRADQLNINAANALLKTLEEPSGDTVLLLLQESGRPLIPTIRSRCQTHNLPVPEASDAERWLVSQLTLLPSEKQPESIAVAKALMLAGNAPRLALDYLNGGFIALHDAAFCGFRDFMKNQMTLADAAKAFKALGLDETLWLFEGWAADLARLSAGSEPAHREAADMLRFLAGCNPPWRAHALLDAVHEGREAVVYNASPELEASRLLLAWQQLMPKRQRAG
ncbi:DNA polymerase-3 subunit delta' [Marinobacter sp. LV10MA510-1]|nr:DNA polymerase-3 subunit delta' [Marinobacter sp. LV10MA510-1]PFG54780.1 DNA polymerase-3 subunit delta' [Marinobacter sp. LV10R520-4]